MPLHGSPVQIRESYYEVCGGNSGFNVSKLVLQALLSAILQVQEFLLPTGFFNSLGHSSSLFFLFSLQYYNVSLFDTIFFQLSAHD